MKGRVPFGDLRPGDRFRYGAHVAVKLQPVTFTYLRDGSTVTLATAAVPETGETFCLLDGDEVRPLRRREAR